MSALLNALDAVMLYRSTYNIRVVNMSLGMPAIDSYKNDAVCRAVRRLVDVGIVVVAAAGNDGKDLTHPKIYGRIHSPGDEPSAITVGAANTFGTNGRADDVVTTYSSRGPTRGYWTSTSGTKHYDNLIKPDLVAPGNKIIGAASDDNKLVVANPSLCVTDCSGFLNSGKGKMQLSGTSVSAPIVAGAVAVLLEANPKLTPNMIKMILMYTAQPLKGFNMLEQGAGELNIEGAVRLAQLVRTDLTSSTAVGSALLTGYPPNPQTTIAGQTFKWSQGVLFKYDWASGSALITKYQAVYGLGVLISDGVVVSDGVIASDFTVLSTGVVVSDNIIISNGGAMCDGSVLIPSGVLAGDGVVISDGVIVGDGVVISDGVVVSDGLIHGNGIMVADGIMTADSAMNGDNTAAMALEK
jgi:subtilisin family serine protease